MKVRWPTGALRLGSLPARVEPTVPVRPPRSGCQVPASGRCRGEVRRVSPLRLERLECPWLEAQDADVLETARLRYRGLAALLSPLAWHARVAGAVELLREVARGEAQVLLVERRLSARAAVEGWPTAGGVPRILERVSRAREQLVQRVALRLGRQPRLPLPLLLRDLEEVALMGVPPPGDALEAWALAIRLLPRNLPELQTAVAQARTLQPWAVRAASLPAVPGSAPPSGLASALEATALASRALESIWARLLRLDLSGRVAEVLRARARAAPRGFGSNGAEQLCAATFWMELARTRLIELAAQLVAPVVPRSEEVRPLLQAWVEAGGQHLPRLQGEAFPTGPRSALLQLAMAAAAPDPLPPAQLARWAREASGAPLDPGLGDLMVSLRASLVREGAAPPADASLEMLLEARQAPTAAVFDHLCGDRLQRHRK